MSAARIAAPAGWAIAALLLPAAIPGRTAAGCPSLPAPVPTGGAVTVTLSKLAGAGVKASWFDPRTGGYTAIGDFPNNGTRQVDAPGATAPGNDWVLVLDATATKRNTGP
jgi:hypothetical protein